MAENLTIENCKSPEHNVESHDYDHTHTGTFTYDFKWEGIVEAIEGSEIRAKLIESKTDEIDELVYPIKSIPIDDQELIEVGALFNFYVGYSQNNGTIKNSDFIKFRRKSFDQIDIDDILDSVNEIGFSDLFEEH